MEIRPILSTLRRHKTAAALIVIEIALACAIVCNALFLVSQRIDNLQQGSGIAEHELVELRLSGIGVNANADAITREDLAALRAIPGVSSAIVINQVPFQNGSWNTGLTTTPEQESAVVSAAQYMGGEGVVQTLGLKLVAGRDFQADEYLSGSALDEAPDASGISSAIIVTASVAKKMFPDESAVGKTVYMANIPLHIVGVVETLARPSMMAGDFSNSILLPIRQNYNSGGFYLLRTDPARRNEILKAGAAALDKVDSNRLVLQQRSFDDVRNKFFSADRDMIGLLLIVCAALLLVTALGIIGLASFWVQQRTRQIGVRRALGATRAQILHYFQTENFILATLGIVLGMLLAFAINQLLMSKYELPRLPWQYLPIGAGILWLLGQISVLWPARRASNVPPAIATRSA